MKRLFEAALLFGLLAFAACRSSPQVLPEDRYRDWLARGHADEVEAYRVFLQSERVADIAPMPALLRTARRWQECGRDEFAIPPRELWQEMPPTLRLVARLRSEGLIDPSLVRSSYRDPDLNRCAGGAAGSKHLRNRALDFDLPSSNTVAKLCDFWRLHGTEAKMGLGFYTATTIHVDTEGYRTWGEDHTRRTSLCLQVEANGG